MVTLHLLLALVSSGIHIDGLPDNSLQLWRMAYRLHRMKSMSSRDEPRKSYAEVNADLRRTLRDHAAKSAPIAKEFIKNLESYIDEHANDSDPKEQATVRDFRRYKMRREADLRWYQRILDASESDPIPVPK